MKCGCDMLRNEGRHSCKTTDPDTIARGIVLCWNESDSPKLEDLIAAALREYGNQIDDKWRAKKDSSIEGLRKGLKICEERLEKSDAEGYARGLLERHKPGDPLCDKCDEAGYRRGVEETEAHWAKACATKEREFLQRGQEGEK